MKRKIILTTNDVSKYSKEFIVNHLQFRIISLMITIGGFLRYDFDVLDENLKENSVSNETLWNDFFNRVFQNRLLILDYFNKGKIY